MATYRGSNKRYTSGEIGKRARPRIIALEHTSLACGEKTVLRDISLHVYEGEAVAIIGAPNSGKSLLLASLLGLIEPARGTIQVLGTVIPPMTPTLRKQIGVMPQGPDQAHMRTVIETLLRYAAMYEISLSTPQLFTLCQQYQLEPDMPVSTLMPLQQRLLGLALAIVHDPTLVLLDEPLQGFAGRDAEIIQRQLHLMSSEGRTLLVTYATPVANIYLSEYDMVMNLVEGQLKPLENGKRVN